MYILKIHTLKVYGQTDNNNLLNHVVFLSLVHDLLGIISPHHFVAIFDLHQSRVRYVTNIHS